MLNATHRSSIELHEMPTRHADIGLPTEHLESPHHALRRSFDSARTIIAEPQFAAPQAAAQHSVMLRRASFDSIRSTAASTLNDPSLYTRSMISLPMQASVASRSDYTLGSASDSQEYTNHYAAYDSHNNQNRHRFTPWSIAGFPPGLALTIFALSRSAGFHDFLASHGVEAWSAGTFTSLLGGGAGIATAEAGRYAVNHAIRGTSAAYRRWSAARTTSNAQVSEIV